jgi:glyoxylase-like metal-dependent hydrolase (beta-lactamase superfamily II)
LAVESGRTVATTFATPERDMTTSRRDFLATSTLAAIAAALGRSRTAYAFSGLQPPQAQPVWTPIRRNVGFFTMQGGTIGYLAAPGATVVVDSQFPAPATAFLDGMRQKGSKMPVDLLINTHHHGDHTGGNISFRGSVKSVVAHEKAAEHMRNPPGAQPPADQLYPDTTFATQWSADAGDEKMHARYYGHAHTSGDVVVTFERANVAHMGDLMFNQRHPVVDRAAGASLRNWVKVLEAAPKDHDADTVYIFGHANTGLPVTGSVKDLAMFHDYIAALLAFVETQVKAGKSRDEVLAMREPLRGFESFGRFGTAGPRDPLTCAYEEVVA